MSAIETTEANHSKGMCQLNAVYTQQRKTVFNACLSGGYTLKEIDDHFQKHYSTISRIVKDSQWSMVEKT